jgi:hypothetical protein
MSETIIRVLPLEEISRVQYTTAKNDKASIHSLLSQDSFISYEGKQPHVTFFMYLVHDNRYYRGPLKGYLPLDFQDALLKEKAETLHVFIWEKKPPVMPGEPLPEAEPLPQRKRAGRRR